MLATGFAAQEFPIDKTLKEKEKPILLQILSSPVKGLPTLQPSPRQLWGAQDEQGQRLE